MILGLFKAFGQLTDPRLRPIVWGSMAAALACWVGLAAIAGWVVRILGLMDGGWTEMGAGILLGAAGIVVPLLFFSSVATFVASFWLDRVCDVVEARHYPDLAPPRVLPWPQVLLASSRFLLVMVAVTAAAAPFYLALLFFGLGVILNYAVNGYLLGREYFELVAARRMDHTEARLMFRNHLGRFWLSGAVVNLLFQVPILNLTAPVVAAAFMVHVVQALPPRPMPVSSSP